MNRKDDHIRVCLEETVDNLAVTSGFERYHFDHDALPELDLNEVKTETSFLGKVISAPFMVGAMTGGTTAAGQLNRILAEAAEAESIPLALGSQRPMLEDPAQAASYWVRDIAPTIPIIGNVGAVQLNYGVTVDQLNEMVDRSGVDALFFHLNPLQEAIQHGGDTRFTGLLERLEETIHSLNVPAFIKEVGSGISVRTAQKLEKLPLAGIEVAGVGGTSWAKVEAHRTPDAGQARAGHALESWGTPTAESVRIARKYHPEKTVIASGGIRGGQDIAKSIALGADMAALARPFLVAAQDGVESVRLAISELRKELQIVQFVSGASTISGLRTEAILRDRFTGEEI